MRQFSGCVEYVIEVGVLRLYCIEWPFVEKHKLRNVQHTVGTGLMRTEPSGNSRRQSRNARGAVHREFAVVERHNCCLCQVGRLLKIFTKAEALLVK